MDAREATHVYLLCQHHYYRDKALIRGNAVIKKTFAQNPNLPASR